MHELGGRLLMSGLAFRSTRWPVASHQAKGRAGLGKAACDQLPKVTAGNRLSAPLDEDVSLLVTDGRGTPYILMNPSRLTAAGWVSSNKGTPLAVTPVMWRSYFPPRSRRPR
jgi:hypothetical protein